MATIFTSHVRWKSTLAALLSACLFANTAAAQPDPLPSWNALATKKAIVDFVGRVTREGGPEFVPPAERIAVFDNDGTLWTEQPIYTQAAFAIDRVKALAPQHPEWREQEPFAAVLRGDLKSAFAGGEKALVELLMVSHSGMTTDKFATIVKDWISTTRHPRFKRLYSDCVYLPMLELLRYLRANGFKTYIVSGGGVEFMRPWTEKTYGVPPEQVVGSSIVLKYELRDGEPVLLREPKIDFIDDGAGKPVCIQKFIGRRPIAAFGNSDGDYEMLRWTTAGTGPRFGLIVHHTDAEREYAYDRESHIGKLDKGLTEAAERGWAVVDMKRDWKEIFAVAK